MTCEEFEELSGAYALDAVTPAEREAAQAHLAGCAACTRHLQELRAVVDLLPYSVTQVNPPASSKERLLKAIRMESIPTRPVPINRNQRPGQRRWSTPLLAIAAVLLLLLCGGMTAWNVSLQHQNASLGHQVTALQQQNSLLAREVASLQHQVALAYTIRGNAFAQGASGELIYLPGQNITLLVIKGLPQLHGTQVYQGWLIQGKQPTSIGLLSMENGIASVTFPSNIAGYEVAAVSREPGPMASKSAPTGPVVAAGELKQAIEFS
jgi:anti-sigma-K factor RskA